MWLRRLTSAHLRVGRGFLPRPALGRWLILDERLASARRHHTGARAFSTGSADPAAKEPRPPAQSSPSVDTVPAAAASERSFSGSPSPAAAAAARPISGGSTSSTPEQPQPQQLSQGSTDPSQQGRAPTSDGRTSSRLWFRLLALSLISIAGGSAVIAARAPWMQPGLATETVEAAAVAQGAWSPLPFLGELPYLDRARRMLLVWLRWIEPRLAGLRQSELLRMRLPQAAEHVQGLNLDQLYQAAGDLELLSADVAYEQARVTRLRQLVRGEQLARAADTARFLGALPPLKFPLQHIRQAHYFSAWFAGTRFSSSLDFVVPREQLVPARVFFLDARPFFLQPGPVSTASLQDDGDRLANLELTMRALHATLDLGDLVAPSEPAGGDGGPMPATFVVLVPEEEFGGVLRPSQDDTRFRQLLRCFPPSATLSRHDGSNALSAAVAGRPEPVFLAAPVGLRADSARLLGCPSVLEELLRNQPSIGWAELARLSREALEAEERRARADAEAARLAAKRDLLDALCKAVSVGTAHAAYFWFRLYQP